MKTNVERGMKWEEEEERKSLGLEIEEGESKRREYGK